MMKKSGTIFGTSGKRFISNVCSGGVIDKIIKKGEICVGWTSSNIEYHSPISSC